MMHFILLKHVDYKVLKKLYKIDFIIQFNTVQNNIYKIGILLKQVIYIQINSNC